MNEDIESIKKRIVKLLSLSKSPNENEAAKAIHIANKLAEKYRIDIKHCNNYISKNIHNTKRTVVWRTIIANSIEQVYATYHIADKDKGEYIFFGEDFEVFMATEMFCYLTKTVDRMVKNNVSKKAKFSYRQSYRQGVANRIFDRMYLMGEECSWRNKEELTEIKNDIKEVVQKEYQLDTVTGSKIKLNRKAFDKGYDDGDNISLSRQIDKRNILAIGE